MITAYKNMFKNWLDFTGRTSIKEYWLAILMNAIVAFAIGIFSSILIFIASFISEDLLNVIRWITGAIGSVYSFVILIPSLSMAVRRLHDQGRPGWIVAACYIGTCCCGIGAIVHIVFMCLPGTVGNNQYGPDPSQLNNNQNFYNGYGDNNSMY